MLLHHQFVLAAKQQGSKVAIVDSTLGVRVTYRQALIRALVLARRFATFPAGFVGIALPNTAATVVAILGTLMSGRIPVMVNYATGLAESCRMAQDRCGFRTIITSRAFCDRLGCQPVDGMVYLEDLRDSVSLVDRLIAAAKAFSPMPALLRSVHSGSEDDTAVLLFTSGSEKAPKAVPLTHRNISASIESLHAAFGLRSDDIFLANLPYFHVFGQTANIWAPFAHQMTIVTVANPLDYRGTCDVVRRERVTLVAGTPTLFWGYQRGSQPGDFDTCRLLLTAADRCPEQLHTAFLDKHRKVLYEAYGATETSPAISANTPSDHRLGSVGRPLGGVSVRIEGLKSGKECAPGESGAILVAGASVMRGYFGAPESTAEVLRNGWYDTGDVGYLDTEGFLWLTGRLRRFAKVGGEMVSLVRVEDALLPLLPDQAECCVVEVPDAIRGSMLIAVVTTPVDEKAVLESLVAVLPMFGLPGRFVVVDELPKTASGKVDFRAVTALVGTAIAGG